MKLRRASVHYQSLPTGEKVKYLRLMYRAGRTTIGRSMLASHIEPEFVARIEVTEVTHAVANGSCRW